ncbi:DUF6776 family protein [Shewanella chilikensis]|uniref:DUF6776 family protein n=1 Tax=Shewanella chilikensis TaxID=558541 RepID=UPI00399C3654
MANYHRWLDRLQVMERNIRPSSLYLLLLVMVAFLTGLLSYHFFIPPAEVKFQRNDGKSQRLQIELQEQAQQLASRNLELSLAKEANEEMQQLFNKQHKKQQELERELAFYRSIMAPEYNAEGVAIHGLELMPLATAGQFRLKLVLTQLQKRKQALKGRSEILLIGMQEGKQVELNLAKLVDTKLAFNFKYFQVLEAEFTLPEGFELQQMKAKVVVPASRWSKGAETEQSFSLPELLEGEKDPGIILEQNSQVTDNLPQQTDVRGSND